MLVFKLIIFDLDGTLVNSYPAIIASTKHALVKLGLPTHSAEAIRRAVGRGDRELIESFVNTGNIEQALRLYRTHHRGALEKKTYWMPYAWQLLRYLKKNGYTVAIASNRPRAFVDIILGHLHVERYFDYILCKDQIAFGKPHPSIINKIIKQLKVPKKRVLYVGDMTIDVRTGKRANVATCAVATGSNSFSELRGERPSFLFRDLSSLIAMLKHK